jgi:hypothetical protein
MENLGLAKTIANDDNNLSRESQGTGLRIMANKA